ncbi:exosome complex exonuclease RRP4, putative [Entamoeba invadens IP1]|uniref:Exosome complex exonuclease RRP4, putative n=1 Tax=Entamoeba invadens IP1 TaxID=370355 RepID=A0A0A1U618_ENTIV|nr:exosome complex exonuclease RRP4, putative [Entamoeba invadens IP1]ELP89770.1 exosome complex exonuclease RRP4, putative [Entamoeba invadens IP1]|eukprot:XP_004256541.1 exosome complex exonuclease RRP4, putative [Entamoeba invadens IP1]
METVSLLGDKHVTPGDVVYYEEGCIPGNGISVKGQDYVSNVHGLVHRINKLVCVDPIRSRYSGDVGDVIVGRIASIGQSAWRVDINAKNNAVLQLSSVNLPDGIQRRRTADDSLNMKSFFDVNELICAEVQAMSGQSGLQIHTRNERYGKLSNGMLLVVHPSLIKRCKSHISFFNCGVKFICGMNGFIFITFGKEPEKTNAHFEKLSRVANCVRILQDKSMLINGFIVEHLYEMTVKMGIPVSDMLLKKQQEVIVSQYMEEMS